MAKKVKKSNKKAGAIRALVTVVSIVGIGYCVLSGIIRNAAPSGWLWVFVAAFVAVMCWPIIKEGIGWVLSLIDAPKDTDSDEDFEDDESDEPDEEIGLGEKPKEDQLVDAKQNAWTVVPVWYNGNKVLAWQERTKLDPAKAPKGYKLDLDTNTYVEVPKPAPKPVAGDKKAMIKRLVAAGYTLEEALDEVEGK